MTASEQPGEAGWSHSAWVEGSSSAGQTKERSLGSQVWVVSSNGQAGAGGSNDPGSAAGSGAGGLSHSGSGSGRRRGGPASGLSAG